MRSSRVSQMIRLFLASLLPSLIALIALPALARSGADRPVVREPIAEQDRRQEKQAKLADATVNITDSAFNPAKTSIRVGQTVEWTNGDERDHQVSADKGAFKSGTIKPGASFSHKFDKAGEFKFHCPLHPRAKGTISVKE